MRRLSRVERRPGSAPNPRGAGAGPLFTRQAVRDVDRLAVERYAMPSIVLMENAAIHASDLALAMLGRTKGRRVAVLCGPGNNGGDGLAMARHLHNAGVDVSIVLAAERARYAGDAATNLTICERMGLQISEAHAGAGVLRHLRRCHLIVDALLGTGLDRPVQGPIRRLIDAINEAGRAGTPVLAVDIPSGLDADTGEPLGAAVRATVTVTFVGLKAGFRSPAAQPYLGECHVAGIGAPRELVETLRTGGPRDTPRKVGARSAAGRGGRRK